MTATLLLTTKLYAPPVREGAVRRPAMVARLEEGVRRKLTVVSAPAGFGKSSLLAEWVAGTSVPVAWLSLEEDDREPYRFLAYLIAALTTHDPALGERAARSLHSSRASPPADIVANLVNDLAAGAGRLAIVLDDFHRVDVDSLRELVAFLIEHAPSRLHLVLLTRIEPVLPLARWRARDEVTELRTADLRFTPEEAATFLAGSMGLTVTAEIVRTLSDRTEGWVAGLQLAALSLRGREDAQEFVRTFAGEHRHVLDYLAQEVLRGQSQRVRSFLLATSVLERMCGPLCNAVTGRNDGARMLEELERANLFLVPLDDDRRWFRYHALFAEVLRAEAGREGSEDVSEFHARASAWYEGRAEAGEAIHHARLAGDVGLAARLLEGAWRAMDRTFQTPEWQVWATQLPEEVLRARPVLAVALAWARLGEGDLDGAGRWLDEATDWLGARQREDPAVARAMQDRFVTDEVAFRSLPARIAAARAYQAQAKGDGAAGEAHARRAIELAPDDDPGVRAVPAGLLGLAHWARGELDEGIAAMRMGMNGFKALGDTAAALSFTFGIAEMQIAQGCLREALRTFDDALRYSSADAAVVLPGTAEIHLGLSELLIEQGRAQAAEEHLRAAEGLGDDAVLPGDAGRFLAARARVEAALGNAVAAHALLDEAERRHIAGPVPLIRPPGATRARMWLAQGRLADARAWAKTQTHHDGGLETNYVNDYTLLSVVRIQLATFRSEGHFASLEAARTQLDKTLYGSERGGRIGIVIEALVLLALVDQASGDEPTGVENVLRALGASESEGHHAVFVNEGPAMARLLRSAGRRGAAKSQVRRLLNDLNDYGQRPRVLPDEVESLSDREHDVLRFLRTNLTGPQLARELGMSLHTLRSHTKSIYSKLGVHGRREAVLRADELNLGH